MYQILFMPFLQIPSGHHHVADCIEQQLHKSSGKFHCEKVEILSHCYGKIEMFISSFYLKWIHKLPGVYSRIYSATVTEKANDKRYYIYEALFIKKVRELIEQTNPDIIICTHALPSYLLNILKKKNIWSGIVINVYTDYFINDLWGIEHIDYHFVPSIHSKQELIRRGIKINQIFVTGIPIDPIFKENNNNKIQRTLDKWHILISGGNMGAGSIQQLVQTLNPSGTVHYNVLCGKNEALFQHIELLHNPYIQAVPYIDSKEEMNLLYDEADAIITKPGGVTITECLWKRLPVLVYEALPGQEEFNLNYLSQEGLIYHPDNWNSTQRTEETLINILTNELADINERLELFSARIEKTDPAKLIEKICKQRRIESNSTFKIIK